ncbi:hypothetical protein [Nostoc sp. MG11]|uniref:hypothetical protein n=1 Tax=Nostoc sp. MG11 TaxID=2721166 RepID=UPI001868B859|nr:hypothetical protein [Nostoc sp. MG11]
MEPNADELPSISSLLLPKIYQELQYSLIQGWQCFNESENSKLLNEFFEFLLNAGFDESLYRKNIPNPAYDHAAKLIGKPFLETARKFEIQFNEIFPGSFSTSKEVQAGDFELRLFQLKAFYRNRPLCLFLLRFPHFHEKFGFPLAPELKILELY